MAAIDLYGAANQFSSSSSSSSSDQELMRALEPFIRSASSPTSSTSTSTSPFSFYATSTSTSSPFSYYSSSSLPQESCYLPASSSYSYTTLQAPFAPTAATTTSSSFSQLPPLPPTSQYQRLAGGRVPVGGRRDHRRPRAVVQVVPTGLAQGLHVDVVATEGDGSVLSAGSTPLPPQSSQHQQPAAPLHEMAKLDFSEAPWDESDAFHLHQDLHKCPSWEIDWDSILS
uniref:Uncharacterized protein n=1 Tax=Aegilops tauschii TaxID=37682 RepID=M8CWS4_AEGTA